MRELKQNPHAVVARVLTEQHPVEVTSHGQPTGVVLHAVGDAQPDRAGVDPDLVARINQAHALDADAADGAQFARFAAARLAAGDEW
jgi:hypothetical protein